MEISAQIVTILASAFLTLLMSVAGYFAKKWADSLQQDINDIKQKQEQRKNITEQEHRVVINWMTRITRALNKNDIEVEKPEEVTQEIDITEND